MTAPSPFEDLLALHDANGQSVGIGLGQRLVEHPAWNANDGASAVELDVADRDGVQQWPQELLVGGKLDTYPAGVAGQHRMHEPALLPRSSQCHAP